MPDHLSVKQVSSFLDRRTFLLMPWTIYKGDTNWVPPLLMQVKQNLDTRKNPFYSHARIEQFLAWRGRRAVGRIAAIVDDAHNTCHDERAGFFGFFECIDDKEAAQALLGAARDWVAAQDMNLIRGPFSPSVNHECAMLIDGFNSPPQVMMPYNPTYYPRLMEDCGLKKAKDIYAYILRPEDIEPRVISIADKLAAKANLSVRAIDPKRLDEEIVLVRDIYNKAWVKNWGFVPISDEEFTYIAQELKQLLEPSLALLVYNGDTPAGFSLTLPNINEALQKINGRLLPFGFIKLMRAAKQIRSCRMLLMGVVPQYRRLGLDLLLYVKSAQAAAALNYNHGELSWILEDNLDMTRMLDKIGAKRYKTYRFYEAAI